MNIWLNSEELSQMLGKSLPTTQRVIKMRTYKGKPLVVRQEKVTAGKGRAAYLVLWNTDTNQPATLADQSTTGEIYAESTNTEAVHSKTGIKGASEGLGACKDEQTRLRTISDGNEQHPSRVEKTGLTTGEIYAESTNAITGSVTTNGRAVQETARPTVTQKERSSTSGRQAVEKTDCLDTGAVKPHSAISTQSATGEYDGYADLSTDATLDTRHISSIASSGATSARSGVQKPAESGRGIDLDPATSSPLVESSALSLPEQAITDEPDVHGERQAGNGGEVSQRSVAEVITLPVRSSEPVLDSDIAGELVAANGIDPAGNWEELSKDAEPVYSFEDLLYRHLLGRNPASKRTLKCKYTKQYNETGIIPPVLFGNGVDGRKGRSGLKSTLPEDIKNRFEAMIRERADKESSTFRTKRHRRVTVMHRALEKELNQVIAIHKLNQWLKSQPDLKALIKMEDAEKITNKTPSAFPMIPVGNVIMMDGVEADYFELVGGDLIKKPLKPVWIELFDTGSRKLMAMHAYGSESNENSADIFNRFIRGNDFVPQTMHIRPDNAKGFLNLKHVLHELNQHCKATQGGFTFIDDYARPLKPKDKAHLESSHRLFHDWEDTVITHYEQLGRVIGRRPATRRIGNKVVDITITQIDITLEEFNASGLTQEYVDFHNTNDKHRFTEDGVQKIWSPAQRWDAHINDYMTANDGVFLTFGDAESRIVKIHGCRKHDATISKDGTITFQKRRYSVNASLIGIGVWSRSTTTPVKVGLLSDDVLALFSGQNGQFIGEAAVVVSMEAPKHVTDSIKAKVMKADSDTRRIEIVEVLRKQGFIVSMGENGNYQLLVQVINLGLTIELTKELLTSNKLKYEKRSPQFRLGIFKTDAESLLKTPDKIIQYAGEVS